MNNDWIGQLKWTAIAYGLIAAVAIPALLAYGVYLIIRKKRFLPLPRLRPGTWGGYEVLVAFCVMIGVPELVVSVLLVMEFFTPLLGVAPQEGKELGAYAFRAGLIVSPLTLALVLGMLFVSLYLRAQTRPHHYGLSWSRWPANVALGAASFLIVTPAVLGLHSLMNLLWPDEHPFVELARHMEGWEWVFLGFQAVVQAPILEEIVFRGILMGWLRRATLGGHLVIISAILSLAMYGAPHSTDQFNFLDYVGPGLIGVLGAGGYGYWMFRLSRDFQLSELEIQSWQPQPLPFPEDLADSCSEDELVGRKREHHESEERRLLEWQRRNASLAILGSALLFGVFHMGAWPAPIALIPLALALGWLATRTQSLIAPITLHALFNLVAFIVLYRTVA